MEIAVISGKGGTGKSSISAAFATLSEKVLSTTASTYHDLLKVEISSWVLSYFNPITQSPKRFAAGECPLSDANFRKD